MKKAEKKSAKAQINTGSTQINIDKNISENPRSNPREPAFIKWQAPEFEYNPKDVSWYWLSLISAIILMSIALWQGNFLFALFIVIAWFIVVSAARKLPLVWKFKITEEGIRISQAKISDDHGKLYIWTQIEGFDIRQSIGSDIYKELIIKVKSRFAPFLKINIPRENEEAVSGFLTQFISKEEYGESVADSLSKLIGF